ncbi:EamA family transporter [Staphylococcus carnosus]|uniref:Transporter n=1 Tax=Staphylococcus carnosus TaxID=1281 RepID=A0AAJ0JP51_STACA|nr:DMT family transporter [Staphylococcus carnosus]KKB25397.1 transporter [Staphylococcus carnosus]POA02985.1 EamA family transporter [Staphylococcus carnosus]QQS84512.1 EamA family transporter [Staphylococcus carnosus]QRQ04452.1 EamA family transporter [Staphylococcus carnosus]UTB83549.1 transporter [Staphylococcus carnosus]
MAHRHQKRWPGFVLVIIGAVFWGVGGTVSQWLFENKHLPVTWFVGVRLLVSGLLLILTSFFLEGKKTITIWTDKKAIIKLIVYSLLGMLGVQYCFMATIHYGNAAVATLLQYLGPVIIILYLVATKVINFKWKEGIAVTLALGGTFLLLTNGSLATLSVPMPAIVWGLMSAFAMAFYTIYPVQLLAKWGTVNVVGWAMFIAGIFLNFLHPIWQVDTSNWDIRVLIYIFISVILGTMFAFWLFISSLNYLYPQEASVLGTIEPLTAILLSVVWLGVSFGIWQVAGVGCIVLMVIFLAVVKD